MAVFEHYLKMYVDSNADDTAHIKHDELGRQVMTINKILEPTMSVVYGRVVDYDDGAANHDDGDDDDADDDADDDDDDDYDDDDDIDDDDLCQDPSSLSALLLSSTLIRQHLSIGQSLNCFSLIFFLLQS